MTAAPPSCGLLNDTGSACHVNAVLQALAHLPDFVRTLLRSRDGEDPDPVYCEFRRVLVGLWAGIATGGRPQSPSPLLRALAPVLMRLGAGDAMSEQLDAHEVYLALADAVVDGTRKRPSLAAHLLGCTRQLVRCSACGATSSRSEPFTTLSLALPCGGERRQLTSLLDAHFAPEAVEGFSCDSCRRPSAPALRICRFWELPGVLALCVKRFDAGSGGGVSRAEVDAGVIGPPALLRMSATGSPAAAAAAAGAGYELASVVCHSGSQAGGHYIACVRRPVSGEWHVHDDEKTVVVGDREDGLPDGAARTGYIYFFTASSTRNRG